MRESATAEGHTESLSSRARFPSEVYPHEEPNRPIWQIGAETPDFRFR